MSLIICVTIFVQSFFPTGPPVKKEIGYMVTYIYTYATVITVRFINRSAIDGKVTSNSSSSNFN